MSQLENIILRSIQTVNDAYMLGKGYMFTFKCAAGEFPCGPSLANMEQLERVGNPVEKIEGFFRLVVLTNETTNC